MCGVFTVGFFPQSFGIVLASLINNLTCKKYRNNFTMVGFSQIILQEFLSGERSINGLSNFSSISTEEIEHMIATPMNFLRKKELFDD